MDNVNASEGSSYFYNLLSNAASSTYNGYRSALDYMFPYDENIDAPPTNDYPDIEYPSECKFLQLDGDKISDFIEKNDSIQNLETMLKAVEYLIEKNESIYNQEYERIWNVFQVKHPEITKSIIKVFCSIYPANEKDSDLNVQSIRPKEIYNTLILYSIYEEVTNLCGMGEKEQLQLLIDIIPIEALVSLEKSRLRTKLLFILEQLPSQFKTMLSLKMLFIDETYYENGFHFYESSKYEDPLHSFLTKRNPELRLIRLAAQVLLNE